MMQTIINLALIVLGFGVLIFVHELGHFLAAKWAGIRTEAFAVGMGPVVCSWRKGIGFRIGSTAGAVEKRVREHCTREDISLDHVRGEDEQRRIVYEAMDARGIGSTEYSLRWLPIGGFVRMLGQEDANPQATSTLKGSYQNTPIGRRMVVVSAGVIANLILALAFFIWSFMVGVPDVAPIVGDTVIGMPAANAVATNADELGITEPGLQPGDRFLRIDGENINAFSDVRIAAAMGRPDQSLGVAIERDIDGESYTLQFDITPQKDPRDGLLSLGIAPPYSTTLFSDDSGIVERELARSTLADQGVGVGMTLVSANGRSVTTSAEFEGIVRESGGEPVQTRWQPFGPDGEPQRHLVDAVLPVEPQLQSFITRDEDGPVLERGLIGFVPLTRITAIAEDSPNADRLLPGDVILALDKIEGPRSTEIRNHIADRPGETLHTRLLRNGEEVDVEVTVSTGGQVGVYLEPALDLMTVARPIEEYSEQRASLDDPIETRPSPLAGAQVWALSGIVSVNGRTIADWAQFRAVLLEETAEAHANEADAELMFELSLPTPERNRQTQPITISAAEVAELHDLGWTSRLSGLFIEPLEVTLTAGGNPLTAVAMGFDRTYKFVINTYLTIDRLFRGTVGVEQLRGPVGIVHLGTQIADRGLMYLIFFLAMISVNLAVINFLPLPIVDGGLFLFLVYEKIKGRPPSVAFQNWATIAGLVMIVGLFLVVTYNDVTRLIFG